VSRFLERAPWWGILAVMLLALAGCGASSARQGSGANANGSDSGLTEVTLQLNWFPEVEHGGFYAALVHGDYRAAGLDVKILPGGPETPVVQQVARRAATFGVVNADNVLFGRAQQAPIVALMASLQNSPRCLIVHESSGITRFDQLKDMTIAMSSSNAYSHFLRRMLPLEGVQIVPYPGNVAQFLLNKNYAQQGYVFSEPFVARKEGGDPRVLMVSDLGFNPYTSLLFAHEALPKDEPELVRKMVAASIRGWQRYLDSPEETNRYIHEVNPQMDLDILAFGAKEIAPLVLDEESRAHGIGTMTRARWQTLADQLIETDQLKAADAQVDAAFTTEFLKTP
jgi:NitT/TauT family transport system substrate-binding protein